MDITHTVHRHDGLVNLQQFTFIKTGINIEGPAPRPLERYKIVMAEDGQILIDKNTKFQQEKGQWELDGAYLSYA